MKGRSGLVTFFLFIFLAVIMLLQFLSLIQTNRLYKHLDYLVHKWEKAGIITAIGQMRDIDDFQKDK